MDLDRYLQILELGGVLSCPTETLQGFLADALNPEAVRKVVEAKRRGTDPIALILPSLEAVELVAARVSSATRLLALAHWPGPLTLLVHAHPALSPALVRDGKVGVRVPGPSPALDLVRAFGRPLTATSANPSGLTPARTEVEARGYFAEVIDGFVPGDAPGGEPSTLVDATLEPPRILRAGAIREADLRFALHGRS